MEEVERKAQQIPKELSMMLWEPNGTNPCGTIWKVSKSLLKQQKILTTLQYQDFHQGLFSLLSGTTRSPLELIGEALILKLLLFHEVS